MQNQTENKQKKLSQYYIPNYISNKNNSNPHQSLIGSLSLNVISNRFSNFQNKQINSNTTLIRDTLKTKVKSPLAKTDKKITYKSTTNLQHQLNDLKQKLNKINSIFFTKSNTSQENKTKNQSNSAFSKKKENLEKLHYNSQKNIDNFDSSTKSSYSKVSTQADDKETTFKVLTLNHQKQIFKVIKPIDEGCFGKVYLVQHIATNFICCLKVIKKKSLNDELKKQIIRQIKIQSFLSHPNIVGVYGYSHDQENVYLLLQPCLGGNLYEKMQKQNILQKDVANYIRQACFALDFMHSNDIIHRDIKPQNILLQSGTVKICDFGLAVHSPLLRNTRCGTPLYFSPEMIKSEMYDTKVDVWSIGVLCYELIFKTIPFQIRVITDFAKIVESQVKFGQIIALSDNGKDFILKCLMKNPIKRISIREALEQNFLRSQKLKYRQTIS